MHIAIVSRGAFPGFDGPARRVKYLGAGLASNGCRVSLIVTYPPNPVPCDDAFEARYGYRYIHTMQVEQAATASLGRKLFFKMAGTMKAYRALRVAHAVERVDSILICGVGFVELIVAWWAARRLGAKLTVDKNDTNYRLKTRAKQTVYGYLSGLNIAFSDFLLARCSDMIFTVNRRLGDFYRAKGAKVGPIVPSFIDRRELDAVSSVDETFDCFDGLRLLCVVTTPYHSYGFIPFAKALSTLQHQYRLRLFLLCSEDRETLDCVNALLARCQLAGITRILTRISPDIVQSVYAGADIILNSQQEPALAEGGFPGKTAEVLASARPIITTLFSDVGQYYADGVNCLVVRYGDIPAYVSAISQLCHSPELRQRLGREGRKTALECFEYVSATRALARTFAELSN